MESEGPSEGLAPIKDGVTRRTHTRTTDPKDGTGWCEGGPSLPPLPPRLYSRPRKGRGSGRVTFICSNTPRIYPGGSWDGGPDPAVHPPESSGSPPYPTVAVPETCKTTIHLSYVSSTFIIRFILKEKDQVSRLQETLPDFPPGSWVPLHTSTPVHSSDETVLQRCDFIWMTHGSWADPN